MATSAQQELVAAVLLAAETAGQTSAVVVVVGTVPVEAMAARVLLLSGMQTRTQLRQPQQALQTTQTLAVTTFTSGLPAEQSPSKTPWLTLQKLLTESSVGCL
jgi:hypothetical protein